MSKFYLLVVQDCELTKDGPYKTEKLRLRAAKKIYKSLREEKGDLIFTLDVDADGTPHPGTFISGDLE